MPDRRLTRDEFTADEMARVELAYQAIRDKGLTPMCSITSIDSFDRVRCCSVEIYPNTYGQSRVNVMVYPDRRVQIIGS